MSKKNIELFKAWERMFRAYEGDLEKVRRVYATLPRRSHNLEVKYSEVSQKWDQMLATAEANNERWVDQVNHIQFKWTLFLDEEVKFNANGFFLNMFYQMDKFLGRLIVCRLKAVDSVLSGVESMKQVVADFEIALVSQDTMTSDPSSLYQLREELQVIRRL